MATPTKTWQTLARRLGHDGNPLRRPEDRVAAWLVPAAIVAFLIMCPLVIVVAGMFVRADNAAMQREARSWQHLPAVLVQAAPGPAMSDHGSNSWLVWAQAQWTTPDGKQHHGDIPVASGSKARSNQTVYLDAAGNVRVPPLTPAQVRASIHFVSVMGLGALAVLVGCLAWLASKILDRRRLAGWESEWLVVAPRWSRQG